MMLADPTLDNRTLKGRSFQAGLVDCVNTDLTSGV
jgi:hypothetical protein